MTTDRNTHVSTTCPSHTTEDDCDHDEESEDDDEEVDEEHKV
jgi:hypothetical protein